MAEDAPAADKAVEDAVVAAPTESASPASIAAPAKAVRAKAVRLHVQELGADMTSEALLALFTPHGTVKGGEAKTGPDGKCRGVGFVIMSTEEGATKAIAELNGTKHGEKSLNVFRAPESKEKGKDKGEGKGKSKGKGKGQGQVAWAAQQQQQAFAMNPYPFGYVDPAYAMMDPAMMQMMQQMYMTQLYAAQMQPSEQNPSGKGAGDKGKGNGKGKEKGKEKGKKKEKGDGNAAAKLTAVEGTFTGTLKSINPVVGKGYGFIECAQIMEAYSRDVFVGTEMVPAGAKVGDKFQFNVALSEKGQPRATKVMSTP